MEKFELLFGLAQLVHHASLLEDGVSLHEVLTSVICINRFLIGCVLHNDHESADDLLCLGKLRAGVAIKKPF